MRVRRNVPRSLRTLLDAALWKLGVRAATPTATQRRIFTELCDRRAWASEESVSGPGSTVVRALQFRDDLVAMLRELRVRSMLDAPCGDFNWMRLVLDHVDVDYTGVDIVESLVETNRAMYGSRTVRFLAADFTAEALPQADLILCRDALVHLSHADIRAAVDNFRRSGSRYLLATTFTAPRRRNADIRTGGWRPLNLQAPPFSFPSPLLEIDERCEHTGGIYRDKRLGLWELAAVG